MILFISIVLVYNRPTPTGFVLRILLLHRTFSVFKRRFSRTILYGYLLLRPQISCKGQPMTLSSVDTYTEREFACGQMTVL